MVGVPSVINLIIAPSSKSWSATVGKTLSVDPPHKENCDVLSVAPQEKLAPATALAVAVLLNPCKNISSGVPVSPDTILEPVSVSILKLPTFHKAP